MTLTNPYCGIRQRDKRLAHRLNLDVAHSDVQIINGVLLEHGGLQKLLTNIIYNYARYITENGITFDSRDVFLSRCTESFPFRLRPDDNERK